MEIWMWAIIIVFVAIAGAIIGYFIKQAIIERSLEKEKAEADRILTEATQKAQDIELEAKNKALEVRQAAEAEIVRRRNELSKEEDRLQKRREELDIRTDRLEKREQAINKRQSVIDKRANEVEKLYEQEIEELQRISAMSIDEARQHLLDEVEKDTRTDMARIIRQIEAEAR